MRRALLLSLLAAGALVAPKPVDAQVQPRDCNLIESVRYEETVQGGVPMITITGPFLFRCADGTELRANFGTLDQATRELFLNGNVFYRDPERQMTSQQARYSSAIRRLHATGDVVFTDVVGGSVLRGPELEYYRVMPGRPLAQVIATSRPHVTLQPRSQRDTGGEPLEVDADRVTIVGEDQFSAVGRVVITRSDIDANANEARYDSARELLELRGSAQVRGEQFDLTGDRIDAILPEGGLQHVLARRNAALQGEDLRVQAPELQLFFARDSLERMVARGEAEGVEPGRATAISRTFRLDADSLDALLPGQRLERVIAVGSARGEARDTTEAGLPVPEPPAEAASGVITDRDWILGDTIIGFFSAVDTVTPPPNAAGEQRQAEVQLDRILAQGSARSLYRIRRNDAPPDAAPALNYLAGDHIELTLTEGELEVANVTGLRRGLYLDPAPPAPAEEAGEGDPSAAPPAAEPAPPTPPAGGAARAAQRGRP
ncbi:MAG TPA: hypothetical protein VGR27_00555 [Longimicrobiaceae bacterium]|nr:hypothetical protein [Longimicrobiaceae bacterium]